MQVGIWIRVSTEDQARGESPRNHEHRARLYAEFKGWDVVEIYDLSGVSGKTVVDHPEAKRMLADIASGKIQALIFSKLARLARNVRELLDISDHFQKHGANLVSLEESIDTSTPAGRLLFTVIGALAQWEREEISARVAASVPVRARLGKPTGGKGPFGYQWIDRQLVVNSEEAPTVREIFSTFLQTKRLLTTAEDLNRRGFRTRQGAKWGKTTIKRILTDPTYKGTKRANYSQSKGDKKSWILKPEKEWVYFDVEPIITEKTWKEVNTLIRQNAEPYPSTPPPIGRYAFSGLLTCGSCGKKMYVMKYEGMKTPRYMCRSCKDRINEDTLLEQFREGLRYMVVRPEMLHTDTTGISSEVETKEKALSTLQNELRTTDRRIDTLLDHLTDGNISKEIFEKKIKSLQERKGQLEKEIPTIEAEISAVRLSTTTREALLSQVTTLYSLWDDLNYEERTGVVRELTNNIKITPEEVNFKLFYLPEVMELCKSDYRDAPAAISAIRDTNAPAPTI